VHSSHGRRWYAACSVLDMRSTLSFSSALFGLVSLMTIHGCQRTSSTSPTGPNCDAEFDRGKYEEKWRQCKLCEREHRGMGTMELDCKKVIPPPWK